MLRDTTCGELRIENVGKEVELCGWVSKIRNLGALCFVDLRDTYGITQINIEPTYFEENKLHNEYCIQVKGIVQERSSKNKDIPTGDIEVKATSYVILSKSKQTPFIIADKTDALEDTRLKWRYLDLRRPVLQNYLKLRYKTLKVVRDFFDKKGFFEIETPTLIKSTPEGARDYLVPSRTYPGNFYALPQSPQLYKQILMVAGMDKYFQIARCYRDEDQRADRQPEFDQIDVEQSFVDKEDMLNLIEELLDTVWMEIRGIKLPKFERLSYADCVNRFGTDKPDMRFGMELKDVSFMSHDNFKGFEGKVVKAINVKNTAKDISRKKMAADEELTNKFGVPHLMHAKFENGQWNCSAFKFFSEDTLNKLKEVMGAEENDTIIIAADSSLEKAAFALGALRCRYARDLGLIKKGDFKPLFVIDWPLFAKTETGYESMANPFTLPNKEDIPLIDSAPEKMHSTSYDTVMNGEELSSGALRIYDKELQWKVFELLGLTDEDISKRFGFFVDAFDYGFPPEGGFGIGVERLCMTLFETDNIRDVVAFPKNLMGAEPMSSCPSRVDDENIDILGLEVKPDVKAELERKENLKK